MTPDPSGTGGQPLVRDREGNTVLEHNHGVDPDIIKSLLSRAFVPLPIEPIPREITIAGIVVTRDPRGNLGISCEVSYVYERLGA